MKEWVSYFSTHEQVGNCTYMNGIADKVQGDDGGPNSSTIVEESRSASFKSTIIHSEVEQVTSPESKNRLKPRTPEKPRSWTRMRRKNSKVEIDDHIFGKSQIQPKPKTAQRQKEMPDFACQDGSVRLPNLSELEQWANIDPSRV